MADSYRDIVAWQKGMALLTRIYQVTDAFPRREIFGLTQQIRSAALSVPSNIAEGKGRKTKKDYVHFLYRARGSLLEALTQLEGSAQPFVPAARNVPGNLQSSRGSSPRAQWSNKER